MSRTVLALAIGGLLLASSAHQSIAAEKHSGTIVAVDAGGKSVTLDELGPGTPGSGSNQDIKRVISLSPETKIVLAARAEENPGTDWIGGFAESKLAAAELKPGDYATIVADQQGGRLTARSVTVVRPVDQPR